MTEHVPLTLRHARAMAASASDSLVAICMSVVKPIVTSVSCVSVTSMVVWLSSSAGNVLVSVSSTAEPSCVPELTFQIRMVLSFEPLASVSPSGAKATEVTRSVCPEQCALFGGLFRCGLRCENDGS